MNKYIFEYIKQTNYKFITFLILLILILTVKNGYSNLFNGLPWSNKYETISLFILFPLIIFFNHKILNIKPLKYLISVIFIIKIILFIFSNQVGLNHKISNYTDTDIIKSYNSFWYENVSDIQEFDWKTKEHFPIDWLNFESSINSTNGKNIRSNKIYELIKIKNSISTYLIVINKKNFNFKFRGLDDNSHLKIHDLKYNKISKVPLKNGNNTINFEKGKYKLEFKTVFSGEEWELSLTNNQGKENFSNYRHFYTDQNNINLNVYKFLYFIGFVYDILLIIFFVFCFYNFFKTNFKNDKLSFYSYPLCILASLITDKLLKFNDDTLFWVLSLSYIYLLIFITFKSYNRDLFAKNNGEKIFIFNIFFSTLIYSVIIFYNSLETTFLWTAGDDWTTFHKYARLIVVNGELIRGGEDVYFYRPGIRYIFALLHLLFGNSSFTVHLLDIWSILFIFLIIFLILKKVKVGNYLSLACSLIFLLIIFGESFRWLIGRGLTEYFGTLIMILIAYLCLKFNLKINRKFFLICFLIIISAWLREEKFIAAFSLILLTSNFKILQNYFYDTIIFFKDNLKIIVFYILIIFIGFPILFITRNYYYSGDITALDNPVFLKFSLKSIYTIVMGVELNSNPRFIALIIVPAFIISIFNLISFRFYRFYDLFGFSIVILSLTLPTLIFEIPGYIPRHSIYLLPFAIITNAYFIKLIYSYVKKVS